MGDASGFPSLMKKQVPKICIQTRKTFYCQEWEIDQLVQFCMHNFIFWFLLGSLRQNILPKYAPPRRTNSTLKWRGGEAAPPVCFIFTPSRRGIFWSNSLQLTKAKINKWNCACGIVAIGLSPTLDNSLPVSTMGFYWSWSRLGPTGPKTSPLGEKNCCYWGAF